MLEHMSTRDQLLNLLKTEKRLTVTEMSSQLGITGMAIRRHLNNLEREGYIQTSIVRKNMGRPVQIFSLSQKGENLFPKSYANIAVEFLEDIEAMKGQELVAALFQNREARLEEKYKQRIKSKTFIGRVAELAEIQNESGYMVNWKETSNGVFEFIEHNCPIYDVASKYNQACSCEVSLFKKVLQTGNVEQIHCMVKGGDACQYVFKAEKEA
ncbi:transcriptional regulator [Bacillus aquiflavi]|uniref:Transcriptional regulator n=1 Tax=Bacillus aquiflavi TaxID=2672567 RepID=A0A6B3W1M2_9BACI|nr:metalloregulator ArsR/SmtB family transcription factor [Bacillus aquiflavi]MBA4537544.1 transcriptional regulator [Bacillus aquiflavi]NEY81801.1 transcriptional regulator [Bacillus aquiflavi]